MRAAEQSYGFWHRSFHWILFGLIAAQYVVGSVMPHIGRDTKDEDWVAWHFSIGAAILFFLVLRFALRLGPAVPLSPVASTEAALTHFTPGGAFLAILVMTSLGRVPTGIF